MKRKNEKKAMVGMLIVATMIGTLANPVNISANEGGKSKKFTVWAWDANVEAIQEAAKRYNDATGSNIELDVITVVNED